MSSRTIRVDYLARVEGEGALTIRLEGNEVRDVELRIFEPPRFFEAFLRGRQHFEAPDITARICGICPVAYQMSSCHAIEDALGVRVDPELRALRRLLYLGEWIESHVLHMFFLHAPDFLGYPDAVAMAKDHGDWVRAALRMKKAGNAVLRLLGGREIHPVNVRLGGFYRVPGRSEIETLLPELRWGLSAARDAVRWAAGFRYPEFERDYEFVALSHPDEYALNEGRLVSSKGLDIPVRAYEMHFVEEHVQRSNALHSRLRERGEYVVGPLARVNLNFDRLSETAREAAREVGFSPPCRNPFRSLLARGVETVHAFDEALRIIESYRPPERASVEIPRTAGTGSAATEAPRGILYHRYRVDGDGKIESAKIVPPTAQNQKSIEEDLRQIAPRLATLPDEEATLLAEHAVRNYDPCISCATHFLKLKIERK
ncbi:MAG: Ni/Fe hydrogenase subunit alpha [Planctomycetes bacterium]|nr:Ni/Fe hydrogenase subunit alpha [Planctomycetota bacterium]